MGLQMPEMLIGMRYQTLEAVLKEYDELLKDKDFIMGDNLTLADFALVYTLMGGGIILRIDYSSKYPNLERYF